MNPPPPPPPVNSFDLPQFARQLLSHRLALVIAALALGLLSAQVVSAATINVNSTCSFFDAIRSANQDNSVGGCTAGSGADSIELSSNGWFTSNAPAISSKITINGNGYTWNGRDKTRLFSLIAGADLTLNNVTLTRLSAGAGGVNCSSHAAVVDGDHGKLTITNSAITNSDGGEGCGSNRDSGWGAINFGGGDMTVTNSVFEDNGSWLKGTATGLAITYTGNGTLTITGSTFKNNRDWNGGEASGGAVYVRNSAATVNITNSRFEDNFAEGYGGAVYIDSASSATITSSVFVDNEAGESGGALLIEEDIAATVTSSTFKSNSTGDDGGGGAIYMVGGASATSTVTGSTFTSNSSGAGGGAIFVWDDTTITITNSKFKSNSSGGAGGAVWGNKALTATVTGSLFESNSSSIDSGAIRVDADDNWTISGTAFYANKAGRPAYVGGAMNVQGTATLSNVTIAGNEAPWGPGIWFEGASLTLNHVTLARNKSSQVLGFGLMANFNSTPTGSAVTIRNSIIAENTNKNGTASDCWISGSTSKTFKTNLIGKKTIQATCQSSENFSGDPFLGFFEKGHLPLKRTSAAMGEGTDSVCAAHSKDQRGKDRLAANCDLGAVEYYHPDYSPPDSCTDITYSSSSTTTVTGTISKANTTQTVYYCFDHTGSASKNITILLEDNDWSKKVDKELRLLDKQGAPYPGIRRHAYDDDSVGPTLISQVPANYAGKHYIAVDAAPYLGAFKYTLTLGSGNLDAGNSSGSFTLNTVSCNGNVGAGFYYATLNKGSLGALSTFDLDIYGIGTGRFDMTFGQDDSVIGNLKHHFSAGGVINHLITEPVSTPLEFAVHHKGAILSAIKAFKAKLLAEYAALASLKGAGALTLQGFGTFASNIGFTTLAVKSGLVYVGSAVPLALVDYYGTQFNKSKYEGRLLQYSRQDVHGWHNALSGLLGGSGKVPDDFSGMMVGGSSGGAIVAITKKKNNPLSTPVYTRTVICAMGPTAVDEEDDDEPEPESSSASTKVQTLSTGAQINADQTDGVRVSSAFGVNSGIQFQRRDPSTVNTIKAANIQTVINAGVKDAIDIWGYAEQQANTCFENSFVGVNGGIMFIENAGLGKIVHTSPATTTNGSETCIQTTGPGLVVLVANMPPGSPQPAPEAAPAPEAIPLANCMTTTTDMLNLRASPGGDVVTILPYNVTLTTSKLSDGWFEVNFHGTIGWVSAGWVTTSGNCGGEESRAPSDSGSSAPASYAPAVSKQAANADGSQSHVVQPGDTLLGIAIAYGVSLDDIMRLNQIANANSILVGQALRVR